MDSQDLQDVFILGILSIDVDSTVFGISKPVPIALRSFGTINHRTTDKRR